MPGILYRAALVIIGVWFALAVPMNAHAWKPYTHNYSADLIRREIVTTGGVNINGTQYPLPADIVAAIANHPAAFNAGAVGPDGFPDLTYGQAVIHPNQTGEWLKYLMQKARDPENARIYSPYEQQKILAFTYGFFVHAAGDVWGHTLINDFADGVFPAISEMAVDLSLSAIAIRHIVSEGIVNDATPGYDGGSDRKIIPASTFPPRPADVSDDSTPSYPYDVPKQFIYEALIRQDAPTPVRAIGGVDGKGDSNNAKARGPFIGYFLDRRAELSSRLVAGAEELNKVAEKYDLTMTAIALTQRYCSPNWQFNLIECVKSFAPLFEGTSNIYDFVMNFEKVMDVLAATQYRLIAEMQNAVINNDIQHIDNGLQNWPDFGLALTQGLFDPQARRDVQNAVCGIGRAESDPSRIVCENGIGKIKVVMHLEKPFILNHMLGMVGFSDTSVNVVKGLVEVADEMSNFFDQLTIGLNPIRDSIAVAQTFLERFINEAVKETLGVDIEALDAALKTPSNLMCNPQLFRPGEMARLDRLLGFTTADHIQMPGIQPGCGRLKDTAVYNPATFAPVKNTITLGKLLLFDGPQLNKVLGDILGRSVITYQPGENILFTSKNQAGSSQNLTSWLQMIDGDHAWRKKISNKSGKLVENLSSNGNFPLWESCVLRPAFRRLFTDWENVSTAPSSPTHTRAGSISGTSIPVKQRLEKLENFPDNGDPAYFDTLNTPIRPDVALLVSGAQNKGSKGFYFTDIKNIKITNIYARYDYPDKAFKPEDVKTRYRVYTDANRRGPFIPFDGVTPITFPAQDLFFVDAEASDPCYGFSDERAGIKGLSHATSNVKTISFTKVPKDTNPPVVTCSIPQNARVYDTDMVIPGKFFTATDGPTGSGVANWYATFDNNGTNKGPFSFGAQGLPDGPAAPNLKLTELGIGKHSITITATDNMGLSSKATCNFELHATIIGLMEKLAAAQKSGTLGAVAPQYTNIMYQLNSARNAHQSGQHANEIKILQAVTSSLAQMQAASSQSNIRKLPMPAAAARIPDKPVSLADNHTNSTIQLINTNIQDIITSH